MRFQIMLLGFWSACRFIVHIRKYKSSHAPTHAHKCLTACVGHLFCVQDTGVYQPLFCWILMYQVQWQAPYSTVPHSDGAVGSQKWTFCKPK